MGFEMRNNSEIAFFFILTILRTLYNTCEQVAWFLYAMKSKKKNEKQNEKVRYKNVIYN